MSKKKKDRNRRIAELLDAAGNAGVVVQRFTEIHWRLGGKVDYWPSTGRAWKVGGGRAVKCSPADAVAMVADAWTPPVVEYESALSHMKSIVADVGDPPW